MPASQQGDKGPQDKGQGDSSAPPPLSLPLGLVFLPSLPLESFPPNLPCDNPAHPHSAPGNDQGGATVQARGQISAAALSTRGPAVAAEAAAHGKGGMEVQGNGLSRQGTTATDQEPGMSAAAVLAPEHARHVGTSHLPCPPPSGLRERALLLPSPLPWSPAPSPPPSCLLLKTRSQKSKSTLTLVLA